MNNKKFYTDPNGYHIYPEKSFDELIEEAKKYFPQLQKKEPETPTRQQPNTNEIKKLSELLEHAFDY